MPAPVRTGAVLLQQKPIPPPNRRSTRPGCECVPTPFAPWAVLLQQNQTQPRTRRGTRPGCEWGLEWDVDCGCPVRTGAVLLQNNQSHLRTVGAPAPGAKGGLHGAWIVPDPFAPRRCSYSKTNPTPNRRSTRPGANACLTPFAPWAVLLQQNLTRPRTRRSTRPGCEGGGPGAKKA